MKRNKLLITGLFFMTFITGNAALNSNDNATEDTGSAVIDRNCICIDLHVGYENPIEIGKGIGRAPVQIPSIYIDGHIIYLNGYAFEEIQLVTTDENGNDDIVFSSVICDETEAIKIPNDITGVYEIRFCRGGYYFYGEVEL